MLSYTVLLIMKWGAFMSSKGMQVGLLLFGMFFGAGNLIFPPSLGFQSGESFWPAILGFIITGVGIAILALIVGTLNPGGYRAEMDKKIHPLFSLLFLVIIYLSIGPFFAIPRTAATSFSVGIESYTGHGTLPLLIFTLLYFGAALFIALNPNKILTSIGKILTPVFAIMIIALFVIGFFFYDQVSVPQGIGAYHTAPFGSGFIEGYNTVDAIAAFAFCIIAMNTLKQLKFSSQQEYLKSVWAAGIVTAIGFSFLYLGLAWLGNHFPIPESVYTNPEENLGVYVLTQASYQLFGSAGQAFLAVMVVITCFTTGAGLIVATAQFFANEFPSVSYKKWACIFSLISFVLSNQGLNQVIKTSLPVLMQLYPMAIVIVMIIVVNKGIALSKPGIQLTMFVTFCIALMDVVKNFFGVTSVVPWLSMLPFADNGCAWFVPAVIGILLSMILPKKLAPEHYDFTKDVE